MRRVTCRTALQFERSVLVDERSCLIRVAPNAACVGTDRKLSLFRLKASVWIVTIAALHRSLENLVMERLAELRLGFVVTRYAQLRLVRGEHLRRRLTWILCGDIRCENVRSGAEFTRRRPVSRMTVVTPDVISPVLTAPEIIVRLLSGMAGQAGLGCRLCVEPLERNYLRYVARSFDVRLAGAMT